MHEVRSNYLDQSIFPGRNPVCAHFWGTNVRSLNREARLFVIRGVFKHVLTGKMNGTGQNRSLKRGVRLSRVFVRRGSTVDSFRRNGNGG